MKALICIIMSILAMICPTKAIKNCCKKLADSAYVISEPNEENCGSIAVRVIHYK